MIETGYPNVPNKGRIIAHRGASQTAPENTLAAFRKALEQGVNWVEFDVSLLGDSTPVLHHDDTLDRCTDGTGPLSALPTQTPITCLPSNPIDQASLKP